MLGSSRSSGRDHAGGTILGAIAANAPDTITATATVSGGGESNTSNDTGTDTDALTPPCGACRQIIWEFCGDVEIILANLKGKVEVHRASELFPKPFDSSYL